MRKLTVCTVYPKHITMGKSFSTFKILTGKPTGKKPLGRPRLRGEDNIKKVL